jgi:hypothetical protein
MSGAPAVRIGTKAEFYRLWNAVALGNKPRTWKDVATLEASGYTGLVTAREAAGRGGGRCRYRVPAREAAGVTVGWAAPTFNEAAPDDRLLLQGEAAHIVGGLYLRFSTTPGLAMREAMRDAREARCAAATLILDAYLAPSSRDDLDALWDLYPGAVIEFGAYRGPVGCLPHRNTLIWEVRHY